MPTCPKKTFGKSENPLDPGRSFADTLSMFNIKYAKKIEKQAAEQWANTGKPAGYDPRTYEQLMEEWYGKKQSEKKKEKTP
jgi:hypothetical protein